MELILVLGGVPVSQFTFLYYSLLMLLRMLVILALDQFLSDRSKLYLEIDGSCWHGMVST
jgi:hypothetical protein